jgi:hypothetical protein
MHAARGATKPAKRARDGVRDRAVLIERTRLSLRATA